MGIVNRQHGLIVSIGIKGKGYILTEQEYCIVVGTINMDIRGMADIRYPQAASHPGTIHCSAGGVGRNIAHNLALLGRDVHLLSVIGDDFYGEMLLEETRRAGVNVSGCVRLHGQSTSTYLAIAKPSSAPKLSTVVCAGAVSKNCSPSFSLQ